MGFVSVFLSNDGGFMGCVMVNPAPPPSPLPPLVAQHDDVEILKSYMTFRLLPKTKIMWRERVNLVRVFIQSIMPSEARPSGNENLFFKIIYIYKSDKRLEVQ